MAPSRRGGRAGAEAEEEAPLRPIAVGEAAVGGRGPPVAVAARLGAEAGNGAAAMHAQ
jgi:hypothetical protein